MSIYSKLHWLLVVFIDFCRCWARQAQLATWTWRYSSVMLWVFAMTSPCTATRQTARGRCLLNGESFSNQLYKTVYSPSSWRIQVSWDHYILWVASNDSSTNVGTLTLTQVQYVYLNYYSIIININNVIANWIYFFYNNNLKCSIMCMVLNTLWLWFPYILAVLINHVFHKYVP